jgi:protein O-GlcNAc transferase
MNLQATCAKAAALHKSGDSQAAERLYREVLAAAPDYVPALSLLGVLRSQAGHKEEALTLVARAASLDPVSVPALMNYAVLLQEVGQGEDALRQWDRLLALKPGFAAALGSRGNLLRLLGRSREAVLSYDELLAAEPDNATTWYSRAIALMDDKRSDEAVTSFTRALTLKSDFAAAFNNRGHALSQLGRMEEALADFDRAVAADPVHAAAWHNRARLLQGLTRYDEALESFNQALAITPDSFLALAGRGYMLWDRFRRYAEAVNDLERAAAINPDADYIQGDLLHLKMHGADWRGFEGRRARIDEGVRAGRRVVRPFAYEALSSSPADLQAAAVIYTADAFPAQAPLWKGVAQAHKKIRIGYVCGAFKRHALAYLAAGLYEKHDRGQFEVIGFDAGRSDNSAIRTRLESAFDKFIPITALGDAAAAEKIMAEDIDILVNVDGYSGHIRMGVFARRPAPVQVNWLGFPGTLGATYMDYIIADRIVIPEIDRAFYSEAIVTLPHAYQVNDTKRAIAQKIPARAEQGLPELRRSEHGDGRAGNAFVFCNFNQSYKITPDSFAAFMRIMRQVPGSVLWLLEANPVFHENLKATAGRQGVDGTRLIFAPIVPLEEHLARMKLADLFLDTLPYNAHTTASDALWAGLPLLTCRGTAFPGRVAASLLNAVGMGELVAENPAVFEALALQLAQDRPQLNALRDKLAQNRGSAALFDTDLYRRHIESAYKTMWEQAIRGARPQSFMVEGSP